MNSVPGEHNGTFRGHNPAFVTGTEAIHQFWSDDTLERDVVRKGGKVREALLRIALPVGPGEIVVRGRGLACGLSFRVPETAAKVARAAFDRGLIVETAGPEGEVVKVIPPLTVTDDELDHGVAVLAEAIDAVRT